jgi:hypothetical protein
MGFFALERPRIIAVTAHIEPKTGKTQDGNSPNFHAACRSPSDVAQIRDPPWSGNALIAVTPSGVVVPPQSEKPTVPR